MKKNNNIFWGVVLLLAGVYIIIHRLGFLPDVNVVRLAVAVVCVVVFVRSLLRIEFGGILFSLAILAILFSWELNLTAITPGPVLVAALLGTIGLDMIFGSRAKRFRKGKRDAVLDGTDDFISGDKIVVRCLFNGTKKSISSDDFTRASLYCKFGGLEVSFDDAVIQHGTATVELDVNFGGVELYVPQSWQIVNHTDCIFGGVDEHRHGRDAGEGPQLVLEGNVRFGGVDIYRI